MLSKLARVIVFFILNRTEIPPALVDRQIREAKWPLPFNEAPLVFFGITLAIKIKIHVLRELPEILF
jgi:hypothetical protein